MQSPTSKDLKWMKWAISGAEIFSTCTRRHYMSILVDTHGHVIGIGYNGVPKGAIHCDEGGCPRANSDDLPGSSYDNCYSIHSELNAIIHSEYSSKVNGCTLYVNGTPCFDCTKVIANSGINRLVYLRDESYINLEETERKLGEWGITLVPVSLQIVESVVC